MIFQQVVKEILSKGKIVMVLGGVDAGKTYFTRDLANNLIREGKIVAIVDSDVGQAYIGPPTTIGLGVLEKEVRMEQDIPVSALYFVGSISPVKFFLPTVVGTKLMVEKAFRLGAEVVIIDTSGLIQGGLGRILKCSKIEVVSPDHIVALQHRDELEHILEIYQNLEVAIHRIRVSPRMKVRTPKMRTDYRRAQFERYFREAREHKLNLKQVGLSYKLGEPKDYHNILVSLDDEKGEVLALGIIKAISLAKGYVSLVSPLSSLDKVRRIQFSEYKCNIDR